MSVANSGVLKVSELEREVEQSRGEVSQTLDELQSHVTGTIDEWRHRLTAEEISREVKGYVASSSRKMAASLTSSVETRFRENPASLVALGVAAAWPVYKIARKIPLPIYLMGAGVALMKPMGRAWEHGRGAFADLTPPNNPDRVTDDVNLADRARGLVDQAAPGLRQAANRSIEQAADKVQSATEVVTDAVGQAASSISAAGHSAGERAKSAYASSADIVTSVGEAAHDAYGSAAEIAGQARRKARKVGARAKLKSKEAAGNPWVLGLIGMAATAALAAALPKGTIRGGTRAAVGATAGSVAGARAAVARAYEVAMERGLASGLSQLDAEDSAREFVGRMLPRQKIRGSKKKKR